MNELLNSSQYFITRHVFQNLLHQALVADEADYSGVLAAVPSANHMVQHMVVVKGDDPTAVISELANNGFVCIGLFHLINQEVSASLQQAMPDVYIDVSVSLDEKGRLDLLACRRGQESSASEEITLVLIEDGQLEADA